MVKGEEVLLSSGNTKNSVTYPEYEKLLNKRLHIWAKTKSTKKVRIMQQRRIPLPQQDRQSDYINLFDFVGTIVPDTRL